ncbi:hypothetical protein LCGC14_1311860 [marine sediment metagenome]|uniref:Uncharacterized protein n=1 Tax=marine sediment metagenome TaxID=412755 RepID=A0A0F9N310_9ZZZZ
MANKLVVRGFFGIKQTFNVASAAIGGDPYNSNQLPTGTWYAGNLFVISTASTGIGNGVDAYVSLASTSGSAIIGIAMENSSDASTAVAGMSQPSGSKVTILHGHSEFEMTAASATEGRRIYEQGSTLGNMESASLMDLVYASTNGKFTNLVGHAASTTDAPPTPVGFVTKVPTAGNSYTLGVILFG